MTEAAWLVENGKKQGEGLAYRFINNDLGGIPDWTEDPNKALRFARREDAEQFACHDEDAWRIVQHAWHEPSAELDALKAQEPVIIEPPEYHCVAMGCGLEDRGITDRYDAMRHGWECAIERVFEQIPDGPLYLAPQPAIPDTGAWLFDSVANEEWSADVQELVEMLREMDEALEAKQK